MASTLSQAVRDTEDIAAGLQVFEDNVPEDPEIHLSIKDLLALAESLRTLDVQYDIRLNSRLNNDVELLLSSLQYTLCRVREMFGETRYLRNGQRLYRVAWEDMSFDMRESEGGQSLSGRLGIYQLFTNDMIDALDGRQLPPGEMGRHQNWIEWLLSKQEPIEEQLDSLNIDITNETRPRRNSFNPYLRPDPPDPPWNNGTAPRPPVPDAPDGFDTGSPTLSTATHSSAQTFTTNSSATVVNGHWAQTLFDQRLPTNEFATNLGPTMCQGTPDRGLVDRLRQHNFYEVAKFTFRESSLTARFYWRPPDHRSRLLISTVDPLGQQVRVCIPLTDLKLIRRSNQLQFFRMASDGRKLVPWGTFSFPIYEKLILFYCVFAAMKNQDHQHQPTTALRDWPHKPPSQQQEQDEEQIFGAPIEDGDYLHALRVYFDRDSGASRLETRPHAGPMKCCPIWTAFITDHVQLSGWAHKFSSKTVQLGILRPYVFCDGYIPLKGRNGEAQLRFRKSSDADEFMSAVNWLRRRRP